MILKCGYGCTETHVDLVRTPFGLFVAAASISVSTLALHFFLHKYSTRVEIEQKEAEHNESFGKIHFVLQKKQLWILQSDFFIEVL